MYKISIAPSAKKQLKKIKKIYQEAINSALQEIKEDPALSKPLSQELTGKYTFHLSVYRIIYKINQKDKVINILRVDHSRQNGNLTISPSKKHLASDVDSKFAKMVDEFINEHEDVLQELSKR